MKNYLSILLICLVLPGCAASERGRSGIWGMDSAELESRLASGDYSFLKDVDFPRYAKKGKLDHISQLHDGAAFYMASIMEELGRHESQLLFLEQEILTGIYRKRAADELFTLLSAEGDWDRIIKTFSTPEAEEFREYLEEALYRSGRYDHIIQLENQDFLTFYSVASLIRAEGEDWRSRLADYLYGNASAGRVGDLYDVLSAEGLFHSLPADLRTYVLAFSSYSDNRLEDSGAYFEKLILDERRALRFPAVFYRLRDPVEKTGQSEKWADYLSRFKDFGSVFTAGRLYSSVRLYASADTQFRRALELAGSDFERDRATWYLMNLYKSNASHLTGLIEETAEDWNDPYYFSDLMEDYLALIAAGRRWDLLERVYDRVLDVCDDETAAAFSWILLLSPRGAGMDSEGKRDLLDRLLKAPHMSFYNIMGTLMSSGNFDFDNYDEEPLTPSAGDDFIRGFYQFSLEEKALLHSRGIEDQLSSPLIRNLSRQAAEGGDYLRSIQLASYLTPDKGQAYSLEDLKLKYPLAYGELIERYSGEYDFPSELLKGIIRTESAFTSDIVSYAGAVGLSQLMPETALEQARKLRIEEPDLTDPETNIRIGSSYVRWILDRPWNDNFSQMLIAYNAGGGNLRKWKRVYPRFNDELFVEALPYKETRNYVKKVITSSVVYGAIYGEETPEEIVLKIYPDFLSVKENYVSH